MADLGWPASYDDDGNPVESPAVMPPPADPMAVARELLNGRSQALRSWRGGWMTWRGPCWAEAEAAEIRSWIYHGAGTRRRPGEGENKGRRAGDKVPWGPNRRKTADVVEALEAITYLTD